MILLLFDAHKLDISDELKSAIEVLKVIFVQRSAWVHLILSATRGLFPPLLFIGGGRH
jgi:hypothetical protein